MKIKHFVLAFVGITTVILVGVFAQGPLADLPIFSWLAKSSTPVKASTVEPKRSASIDDPLPTSGTFTDVLANPQVSKHQDGDTVVVMTATGELPGALTLKLHRNGTTVTGGEFAFNVSYTKVTELHDEDEKNKGTMRPQHEDHSEALIQRGSVLGTISGGEVIVDSTGEVTGINSVQISINRGSIEFTSVGKGTGSGSASNILDYTSTGALTLTF